MPWKLFLALFLTAASLATAQPPSLRFAVLADVQYADKPTNGAREYRNSKAKLAAAVNEINHENVDFVIQLGDLIDEGVVSLDAILPIYQGLRATKYHVLGNHDFSSGRTTTLDRLGLPAPYYDFALKGWRFVVLDGMDVSVAGGWPPGSPHLLAGEQMLSDLKARSAPNAMPWNAGIGSDQQRWLRDTLDAAARAGERVIVFCHFPIAEAASTPVHLLWNHDEIFRILSSAPAVVAYMSGHDHQGGHAQQSGIHFVTFQGMVESGAQTAYAIVDVFPDRLRIHGHGSIPNRDLEFARTRGGGMDHAAIPASGSGCALLVHFAPFTAEPLSIPVRGQFLVAHSLETAEKSGSTKDAYNSRISAGRVAVERLGFSCYRAAIDSQSWDDLAAQ